MMPDSPDSSVLGTPQTTRSGRRTKAPAAFGNVVTSDYVYASDDEDEEGLPVQEDDESPEWGGEKHRIEVDSGDDEEEADESGGDGSDDEEEGGGKSKAAKGKKGKKEPTKSKKLSAAASAKRKAHDTKKPGKKSEAPKSLPKPVVTRPSTTKAKAAPVPKNTKPPAPSMKPTLLHKAKAPAAREKTPDEEIEEPEDKSQDEAKEDRNTTEPPDEDDRSKHKPKPGKTLLPAAPILPAQKSRIDLSGPERSLVPIASMTKPRPKGIVLAKKGSILLPATAKSTAGKSDEPPAKKGSRPGLLKAQPKAETEPEDKPEKPAVEKKPAAKPVKGRSKQEHEDDKDEVRANPTPAGKTKLSGSKRKPCVKKEATPTDDLPIAMCGYCPHFELSDGEAPEEEEEADDQDDNEARGGSGMETDDHDAPKTVKAKTNAKVSAAVKKRKSAESMGDEAETVEKGEDKAVTDDEDLIMTATEENASQPFKHSPAKSKSGGSRKLSGGKRKASSQSDEDSDITKVDPVQEAQDGDEADEECIKDTPSVSKKRKTSASPKKTASRTISTASTGTDASTVGTASPGKKPAPAEKVPAAARLAIIEAMNNKDYIKLVDWQGVVASFKLSGTGFGPAMTPEKLKRHWREVLSADLRDLCRGTSRSTGAGGKASSKEGLTKVHRKAIWKALYDQCDKLDWKTISQEADGMGVTKLKRHFKEAMKKDVDKMIG